MGNGHNAGINISNSLNASTMLSNFTCSGKNMSYSSAGIGVACRRITMNIIMTYSTHRLRTMHTFNNF